MKTVRRKQTGMPKTTPIFTSPRQQVSPEIAAAQRQAYEEVVVSCTWDDSTHKAQGVCPLCHDASLSCSIYPGVDDGNLLWKCHQCELGGTLPTLYRLLGRAMPAMPEWATAGDPNPKTDPDAFAHAAHERLMASTPEMAYLALTYHINRDAMHDLQIGLDRRGRFIFAGTTPEGQVTHIRVWDRQCPSRDRWVWSCGKAGLFGVDALARACQTGEPVMLCTDLFDAAALRKYGYHSIGITSTAGYWDTAWNTLFYNLAVVIAAPNDEDGKQCATMLANQLYGTASEVKVVQWPLNRPVGHTLVGELLQESEKALRTRIRKASRALPPPPGVLPSAVPWQDIKHGRIPNALQKDPAITPTAKLVYAALQSRVDAKTGYATISYDGLGKLVGRSKRQVIRAVEKLEESGWLHVARFAEGARRANCYRVNQVPVELGVPKSPPQKRRRLSMGHTPRERFHHAHTLAKEADAGPPQPVFPEPSTQSATRFDGMLFHRDPRYSVYNTWGYDELLDEVRRIRDEVEALRGRRKGFSPWGQDTVYGFTKLLKGTPTRADLLRQLQILAGDGPHFTYLPPAVRDLLAKSEESKKSGEQGATG